MSPPIISLSAGDQSLHIHLPEGELFAYAIPATFSAESTYFRGEITITLDDGLKELAALHASLLELDGAAARGREHEEIWSPCCGVALTFSLSPRGRLRVEVRLQGLDPDLGDCAELRVWLDADQSYLSAWIRAVWEVVERIH